jgi:hypothetical protein
MTPALEVALQTLCTSGPQEARKAALPAAVGPMDGSPVLCGLGLEGEATPGAGRAVASRDIHAGDNWAR